MIKYLLTLRDRMTNINNFLESLMLPPKKDRSSIRCTAIKETPFSTVLHLGSGRDKREIGDLCSERGEVVAFDIDTEELQNNTTEKCVTGDASQLPFDDNTFDLICSDYVFEHLPAPDRAFAELNRVLKEEGRIFITVPNPNHYYAYIADATPYWFHILWLRFQTGGNNEEDAFPTQYKWGTLNDIRSTATIYGWSIEQLYCFRGPTAYTRWLPIHFLFILLEKILHRFHRYSVAFFVQYRKI